MPEQIRTFFISLPGEEKVWAMHGAKKSILWCLRLTCFCLFFWKKLKTPKKHLEINWTLVGNCYFDVGSSAKLGNYHVHSWCVLAPFIWKVDVKMLLQKTYYYTQNHGLHGTNVLCFCAFLLENCFMYVIHFHTFVGTLFYLFHSCFNFCWKIVLCMTSCDIIHF